MSVNILVVDDAKFMRVSIKNMLEKADYKVIAEAENGREALKKYKSEEPDLVTMDITMPEKDGLEATRDILNYDSEASIIMVSAMGQQKIVIEAIEAGAQDFVVKPFDEKRVLEAAKNVLS